MSDARGLTAPQWQELYQRLEKPLYNFAWRYVWNAQEAEDVVHDAFLQVWERRERIVADTANRYLWVAVLNLSRKRRRWARAKRFLRIENSSQQLIAADSTEADAAQHEEFQRLHAEIERLPEGQRAVLLLAEFSEMRYEEIAELLSISAGTVASRRHLALKQLRDRTRNTR
jgi:RNA polymerase sigma-70 factor (ECF subfamily)